MYQCPNCSANIRFDIARQKLYCSHCDTETDVSAFLFEDREEKGEYMKVEITMCPQCGGQMIVDDNEAAAFCSYCGASNILTSRIDKAKRPVKIIPFQITKKDCIKRYKSRISRNLFAASALKNTENIDSFRGIYMPYWDYSFSKDGEACIQGTKSEVKGNYTYTYHYDISAPIKYEYNGLNHDAAASFADSLSEAVAPYDTSKAIPYHSAYMSGYYADITDVGGAVYESQMEDVVARDAYLEFAKAIPFGYSIDSRKAQTRMKPSDSESQVMMLPVWFMSTRIKEKGQERIAYSVINGQSGKVVGDVPISMTKYMLASLILAVIFFFVMQVVMNLTISPFMVLVGADVFCIIMAIIYSNRESQIEKRETGEDDKGMVALFKKRMRELRAKQKKEAIVSGGEEEVGTTINEDTVRKEMEKASLERTNGKKYKKKSSFVWVPIILTATLFLWQPIEDYWYYTAAIIALLCLLRTILITMNRFNMMCSRPLPQFVRSGGEDRV